MADDGKLYAGDTELGHYEIVDTIYAGRPARVMYSGDHLAAQSGEAHDDKPDLLFDYNQRFMELVKGLRPKRVLLIGGGAFTFPKALIAADPHIEIDVVELDGGLLPLAKQYFEFVPNEKTHIYTGDGRWFLDNTAQRYDLILVDAFTHATVPSSLQTLEAAASLRRCLRPNGAMAMNMIAAYQGERSAVLQRLVAALQAHFSDVTIFPASSGFSIWTIQNFVVTAQNNDADLEAWLRYEPMGLPASIDHPAIHDSDL